MDKIVAIKEIKIKDETGTSTYKISSEVGCCAYDLMPKDVLEKLKLYILEIKKIK